MNLLPFTNCEIQPAIPAPQTWSMKPIPVDAVLPKDNAAASPAFDAEAALMRADGNRELLRKMVGLFAMQWRELFDQISTASRHRDGATLELAAHRLNASLRSFGADEASRVTQELEACGRNGDFHDVARICAALKMEVERLVSGLQEFADEMIPCLS